MPVSKEQILELRRQLQSDRELIGKTESAQPFLDFQESNIEALENKWAERDPVAAFDYVLSEIENNEIGGDSATGEEITEIAKDIREWETALQTVPAENRDLPLFKIAERAVSILKQNCVALADKTDLEFSMIALFESVKNLRAEFQEVNRLVREHSELNLGATANVFQYFRDSLTPALDSVLGKSLGDILSAAQSRR